MTHAHSPYIGALACMDDPTIKMLNQTSLLLYKHICYDMNYPGIVDDLEEGQRLGKLLGDKYTNLILRHHESVSAGKSVALTFTYQIAMETSAKIQVKAMLTGSKLVEVPKEICDKTLSQYEFLEQTPLMEAHLAT